jgi:hypothetical protein
VSSEFVEKNNLYAQIIPISIHTIMTIGVTIVMILLNIKFLILSHHHSVEFGSAATRCSLIGSIDLSMAASNLHSLSTLNEKGLELFV